MSDYQEYFSRTFQVLEFFRKKIQGFSGGVGTPSVAQLTFHSYYLTHIMTEFTPSAFWCIK